MPVHRAVTQRRNPRHHPERHRSKIAGWFRASVLGANDGILSTGALLLGVASANASHAGLITAGVAGIAAGAGSMAIGEFVSVSAQGDSQRAERAMEAKELSADPIGETKELSAIWHARGLSADLAAEVAEALMAHDPLEAHLRDELGFSPENEARPVLAAVTSFFSFAVGGLIPMLIAIWVGVDFREQAITAATILGLLGLGALAAFLGGGSVGRGALRIGLGGLVALAISFGVGALVGSAVA
ncbi:MAG: VIT1/CCC1 transporter family protein [Microthrixaceae bacterium]